MARSIKALLLLIISLGLAASVQASPASEVQAQLKKKRASVSALTREVSSLEGKIAELDKQIEVEKDAAGPAQEKLNAARSSLVTTKARNDAEGTTETQTLLTQAELEFALAERRYSKATKGLTKLQDERKALAEQLAADRQKIDSEIKSISSLEDKLDALLKAEVQQLRDGAAAADQAKVKLQAEVDELNKALDVAKAAILRLEAELAECRAATPAASAASTDAGTETAADLSSQPEASPVEDTSTADPAVDPAAEEEPLSVEANEIEPELPIGDEETLFALAQNQRIKDALSARGATRATSSTGNFLRIRVKGKTRTYQWKYANKTLWTLDATVPVGEVTFSYGKEKVVRNISPEEGNQEYIFLLDTSEKNPELVMFRAALVN